MHSIQKKKKIVRINNSTKKNSKKIQREEEYTRQSSRERKKKKKNRKTTWTESERGSGDANRSITPKGFRDPSAFSSRGSMGSSSFEKRILSYANPYTGIIRQTEENAVENDH